MTMLFKYRRDIAGRFAGWLLPRAEGPAVSPAQGIALGDGFRSVRILSAQRAKSSGEPLGRWPEEKIELPLASPGRCPGLGEPGPFGARLRRGLTLVELLVVITIMMILAAFVLPKLQMNGGSRRAREAARMVNIYLGVARNRAVETGRPCGVMFQRISNVATDPQSTGCAMLYQVEVPPLYAGDVNNVIVRVQDWTVNPGYNSALPESETNFYHYYPGHVTLKAIVRLTDMWPDRLLRPGDLIRFNGQGDWYEIMDDWRTATAAGVTLVGDKFQKDSDGFLNLFSEGANNGTDPPPAPWANNRWLTLRRVNPGVVATPYPAWNGANALAAKGGPWSNPLTIQIQRQPVQTMTPPLALPTGTVVDLWASGMNGNVQPFYNGAGPVTVMFSPNGAISKCYWDDGSLPLSEVPTEALFFLVGKREQLGIGRVENAATDTTTPATTDDADAETMANWQTMGNLWLAINPQTGMANISENATPQEQWYKQCAGANDYHTQADPAVRLRRISAAIDEARTYAKQSRSLGGR